MTNQEITEGNKLIAEFMGGNPIDEGFEFINSPVKFERRRLFHWDDISYNYSWDWLMPVVEKINNTKTSIGSIDVVIWQSDCHIQDREQIMIEKSKKNSLIECVWEAVIEFIKWYNQNK